MNNKGLVLICDRIPIKNKVNLFTDNLEFTSEIYYKAIIEAFNNLGIHYTVYDSPKKFIDNIQTHKNDIIFTAIWSGRKSRNRKSFLPAICEAYDLEYIGADTYVQTICQDKNLSKIFCKNYSIEIPKGYVIDKIDNISIINNLQYPVIVKPNCEGSSIGISDNNIADTYEEAYLLAKKLIKKFSPIIIEEYIDGKEVSICITGREEIKICEAIALVVDGEEYFTHKIWGYETKKCGKSIVTRRNVTSEIDPSILESCKNIFMDLGKVDYMRIDGRIQNGKFYLIELTPDCSLHPECFMANAYYSNNMNYSEMIESFISLADS